MVLPRHGPTLLRDVRLNSHIASADTRVQPTTFCVERLKPELFILTLHLFLLLFALVYTDPNFVQVI